MEVKVIFLPDSPLVLSLLKHKDCMGILEKKKVMNNFIPNYIDLINFKLKCYQKMITLGDLKNIVVENLKNIVARNE